MRIARVAVVGALFCALAYGAVRAAQAPGGDVATVGAKARRDVPFDSEAVCDATTISALSARHPDVRQFVVMQTADFAATSGTVEVAVRTDDGVWRCQRGPQPAKFGRAGTRPLLENRTREDVEALYRDRERYYRLAHLTVDTGGLGIDQAVGRVLSMLRRNERDVDRDGSSARPPTGPVEETGG